jgi:hypothetical protein
MIFNILKSIEIVINFNNYIATASTVTATGTAFWNELFTTKSYTALTTATGLHRYFGVIYEQMIFSFLISLNIRFKLKRKYKVANKNLAPLAIIFSNYVYT